MPKENQTAHNIFKEIKKLNKFEILIPGSTYYYHAYDSEDLDKIFTKYGINEKLSDF